VAISKENPNFGIPEIVGWLVQNPEIMNLMKNEKQIFLSQQLK
jgi:hypothetical protein